MFDRLDNRGFVSGRENQFIANLEGSGFDAAGDDSALVEFVNILHAKTQRQIERWRNWRHVIERFGQCWPLMPFHLATADGDVFAETGRGRNKNARLQIQRF